MTTPTPRRRVVFRKDTVENWITKNPILLYGEPGVEDETNLMKIGDGETPWNQLYYFNDPSSELLYDMIQEHLQDSTPHSVYDHGPSLVLLYENKKV